MKKYYMNSKKNRQNKLGIKTEAPIKKECEFEVSIDKEYGVKVETSNIELHEEYESDTIDDPAEENSDEDHTDLIAKYSEELKRHEASLRKSESMKEMWATKYRDFKSNPYDLIKDGKFDVPRVLLEIIASNYYDLKCLQCSKDFYRLTDLMSHSKLIHHLQTVIECCNSKFIRKDRLYEHMARHFQPSAMQCKICEKKFSRLQTLKAHMETHITEGEKLNQCEECGKEYLNKTSLRYHMNTSHSAKDEYHKCTTCQKIFLNETGLRRHMSRSHSDKKYLCPLCGKSFTTKASMLTHMETHDPTGENKVACDICGLVCKNNATLRSHIPIHCEERFSCKQCIYSTPRKYMLRRHIAVKHSDLKPHTCEVCKKQFKMKSTLKYHMAQHTGERNFSCEYCQKKFASSGNYYTHRKRMHGEKLVRKKS